MITCNGTDSVESREGNVVTSFSRWFVCSISQSDHLDSSTNQPIACSLETMPRVCVVRRDKSSCTRRGHFHQQSLRCNIIAQRRIKRPRTGTNGPCLIVFPSPRRPLLAEARPTETASSMSSNPSAPSAGRPLGVIIAVPPGLDTLPRPVYLVRRMPVHDGLSAAAKACGVATSSSRFGSL